MLKQYKEKRKLAETPEPKGDSPPQKRGELPIFVVQKHDATRLHYDFRLEHEGILLSFAVPKGPSLNPQDKRLAIQVEDHPFEYRDFEGMIPKGNYGAGTVMVWDEGTYTIPSTKTQTKKEIEKSITAGLKKGHLTFILHGHKLNGLFQLVRLEGDDQKSQWLLFKSQDEFVSQSNVTKEDLSVKTGRTLEEIAGGIKRERKKKSL